MGKPYYILILVHFFLTTPHVSIGLNQKSREVNLSQVHLRPDDFKIQKNADDQQRERRSADDEEEEKPFWANRGKRLMAGQNADGNFEVSKELIYFPDESHIRNMDKNLRQETPFWGNRGRRDSKESSEEVGVPDWYLKSRREQFASYILKKILSYSNGKNMCFDARQFPKSMRHAFVFPEYSLISKERRQEDGKLLWGNRGRRASGEFSEDDSEENPFWGNRGRRESDPPFWGARGRRDDDVPFWGARGRRDDDTPFWGARGRREEVTPFWGARGKKEEENPFWGNRGKKSDDDISDNLLDALTDIKSELKGMSRLKRSTTELMPYQFEKNYPGNGERSFWQDRGRNSKLKYLFSDKDRDKARMNRLGPSKSSLHKMPDYSSLKSLRQDTLFAEQPYYIVVDRSSRSISGNDDPYFISRGKKKVKGIDLAKAARDRRGIIEEIAKTVQKDPYFAVRGKKYGTEEDNILAKKPDMKKRFNELIKARELICSAIMLINQKKEHINKREISDRDRNRRAILKKLAAQLQSDPYFVSRGKKSLDLDVDENKLENFVKRVKELCS